MLTLLTSTNFTGHIFIVSQVHKHGILWNLTSLKRIADEHFDMSVMNY
jgi:hypothetical protein